MLQALKNEANLTTTENGALTHISTNNYCLDLFATIGALRHAEDSDIINRFIRAYTENPDIAMKILFFARDIRGGLGERRVFKTILNWLANNHTESANKNIQYIAEYGRFDDMLALLDTPCQKNMVAFLKNQFQADLIAMKNNEEVSLLAKWLPSVNTSNSEAVKNGKFLAKCFGMSEKEYRQSLSRLRAYIKIIENNLREKNYTFDYEKQPSKALFKYRNAFITNDSERYNEYISKVNSGEAKMNTSTLMPYEIIRPICEYWDRKILDEAQKKSINATWNALENYTTNENALAVIDGSGSMYCNGNPMPATVAISLGIYFAERNKGAFKNHFITFSHTPRLIGIKGENIVDKVEYIKTFDEIADTNIQGVFELILNTAIKNNLPQEELPTKLYIISDMEFNCCAANASLTNFQYAKKLYEKHGYKLPKVVFWNVDSRNTQQPVKENEQGVALVSGCTPRLFNMVMEGELNPYNFMLEVINNERYEKIVA